RPYHLFHLLLDRGGNGGIADIGVDLGEEVAADDHRLKLGVIDIGRDDSAAASDLVTHEFGSDEGRDRRAKILAIGERLRGLVEYGFAPEILALGDIDHLLRD